MKSSRSYGQACSVANFLDQLGNRWTLLIVRDLLVGPRRFKELLEGLPGIGANLLSSRLHDLQQQRIIQKVSIRNSRVLVYELTETGRELEPAILAMARWGMRHARAESEDSLFRPDLLVVAFRAAFQPQDMEGVDETYEFRIGDCVFFARVSHGKVETGLGTAPDPALVYITDTETFVQIVSGQSNEQEARESGRLNVVGDKAVYQRFLHLFSTPAQSSQAGRGVPST